MFKSITSKYSSQMMYSRQFISLDDFVLKDDSKDKSSIVTERKVKKDKLREIIYSTPMPFKKVKFYIPSTPIKNKENRENEEEEELIVKKRNLIKIFDSL